MTKLTVSAKEFYPSYCTDTRPHSPGGNGFIITDDLEPIINFPDEELFDRNFHPISQEDLDELEAVENMNEMLADLEELEEHEELHQRLKQRTEDLRISRNIDPVISNLMQKSAKSMNSKSMKSSCPKSLRTTRPIKRSGQIHQPK